MDASFQTRVEQLAEEFANQATTAEELNQLMRLMMKSGLERMLNAEMALPMASSLFVVSRVRRGRVVGIDRWSPGGLAIPWFPPRV